MVNMSLQKRKANEVSLDSKRGRKKVIHELADKDTDIVDRLLAVDAQIAVEADKILAVDTHITVETVLDVAVDPLDIRMRPQM